MPPGIFPDATHLDRTLLRGHRRSLAIFRVRAMGPHTPRGAKLLKTLFSSAYAVPNLFSFGFLVYFLDSIFRIKLGQ